MSDESRAAHRPATWNGREPEPKKKRQPRSLTHPKEPIPDEVDVIDEQTAIDTETSQLADG